MNIEKAKQSSFAVTSRKEMNYLSSDRHFSRSKGEAMMLNIHTHSARKITNMQLELIRKFVSVYYVQVYLAKLPTRIHFLNH